MRNEKTKQRGAEGRLTGAGRQRPPILNCLASEENTGGRRVHNGGPRYLHDNENPNNFKWNTTSARPARANKASSSRKGDDFLPAGCPGLSADSSSGLAAQQQQEAKSRCHLLAELLVVVVMVVLVLMLAVGWVVGD
jgi:hypothetical protein